MRLLIRCLYVGKAHVIGAVCLIAWPCLSMSKQRSLYFLLKSNQSMDCPPCRTRGR